MVNYTRLADDRLDTDMGDYHMITAVTQRAVNKQLERLWKDPSNNLQTISIKTGDGTRQLLHATMGAPRVQFQLTWPKNTRVIFFLEFITGNFFYVNISNLTASYPSLNNSTLAFEVDMDMSILTDPSTDSGIAKALKDRGLGDPGNYHIMQLFLDFTTANLMNYRDKLTNLAFVSTPTSGSDLNEMKSQFASHITKYLEDIKFSPTNLGGHPTSIYNIPKWVKPAPASAATLAPTDLKFQCYPYLISSTAAKDDTLDDNMLLYLEMTKNAVLPDGPFDTSKNWVVPKGPTMYVDGAVALSRKIFLEDWLLPNLAVLNKHTYVSVTASNVIGRHADASWHFNNDQNNPNIDYSFLPYEDNNGSRYWEFKEESKEEAENHRIKIRPSSEILLEPGKAEVVIKGRSEADAWFEYTPKQGGESSNIWATMDWTIKIALSVDNSGKLKATVTTKPSTGFPHIEKGRDEITPGGNSIRIWDGTQYDPQWSVQGELSANSLTTLEASLSTMFQSTWPFFFAGNDVFTFSGATFNNNLDLLLDLTYQ
ncbi:hypothetical protein MSAN_00290100 [Mycena sanguinolenta]|uniref:Uncharacterized protein n=1 Tax=Mycena sanguinolenta TaxID=230812 RepID=A0A8H6ZD52_9AGAR|nr:hypothetical protein MSAN_00290100 [Mycena sanguinolenta]